MYLTWVEEPDDWRQANLSPSIEKGEKYVAANYHIPLLQKLSAFTC